MAETKIIKLPAVMEKTSLAKATIHKFVNEGRFPAPIPLAPASHNRYASGWLESEVDGWIAEQVRAARGEPASVTVRRPTKS